MKPEKKKKCARTAAANNAINPPAAIHEYLRLTGQSSESFSEKELAESEDLQKAREEMLSLLEPYRHPLFDAFTERRIFFAEIEIAGRFTSLSIPAWYNKLKKIRGIDHALLSEIEEYLMRVGRIEIERNQIKSNLDYSNTQMSEAREVFASQYEGEDQGSRAKEVVKYLGFTAPQGRPSSNHLGTYTEYIYLIRHKGFSRDAASVEAHKNFGGNSLDYTQKRLGKTKTEMIHRWKDNNLDFYTRHVAKYFHKLAPW